MAKDPFRERRNDIIAAMQGGALKAAREAVSDCFASALTDDDLGITLTTIFSQANRLLDEIDDLVKFLEEEEADDDASADNVDDPAKS